MRLLATGVSGFLDRHVVPIKKADRTGIVELIFRDRHRDGDFLNQNCRNETLNQVSPTEILPLAWRNTSTQRMNLNRANQTWTEKTMDILEGCLDLGILVLFACLVANADESSLSKHSKSKVESTNSLKKQEKSRKKIC